MTYEEVQEILIQVLEQDILCRSRETFSLDDDLTADLKIDSDDLSFTFVPVLQGRLNVRVPLRDWEEVNTGRDAAKLLFRHVQTQRKDNS